MGIADYAGCLQLPHGSQAVAEIAGVGNHIGFWMKGIGLPWVSERSWIFMGMRFQVARTGYGKRFVYIVSFPSPTIQTNYCPF